ncbi:MAG: hypothetical protein IKS12_04930 [Eubacterium sp.]|nr:hypothetical protein [Eubacterium sp.]
MKQNPDSYLLYEAGKFITYNIRIKIVMKHRVNGGALEKAAQTAFKRFPYYAKKINILPNGEIELKHNDAPICVTVTDGKHPRFGSKELNYHLCSIDYSGNIIYFNIYHGLCGGCGAMFWIKSTLWHYIKEAFGAELENSTVKTADTPFAEGETAFPDAEKLEDAEPLGSVKADTVYVPALGYASKLLNPLKEPKYYELELEAGDFMKYARSNDGSPNSILSALMFKAVCKVTSPAIAKAVRGNILCNYRSDVGCPETYHDLVRLMSVFYSRDLEDKSVEFLSTVTRSMMYVQMQPEFSVKTFKYACKCKEGVDRQNGLLRKRLYCKLNSPYTKPPFGTFLISYVCRDDWSGLEDYVERIHCITDGDLMVEVNALRDKFFLTFMELDGKHKFYDAFCEAMREENIHFIEHGCHKRLLPYSVLPKKSKGYL